MLLGGDVAMADDLGRPPVESPYPAGVLSASPVVLVFGVDEAFLVGAVSALDGVHHVFVEDFPVHLLPFLVWAVRPRTGYVLFPVWTNRRAHFRASLGSILGDAMLPLSPFLSW